jgi:flagellar biosynthesis component FlhA
MIVLGVLLLAVAGAVAVNAIVANSGSAHALAQDFTVFGYAVEGSAGRIFLYGIIVGVAGLLGLALLMSGLTRGARRRAATRRELKRTRQEKESLQRQKDELASELDSQRSQPGSAPAPGTTTAEQPTVVRPRDREREVAP